MSVALRRLTSTDESRRQSSDEKVGFERHPIDNVLKAFKISELKDAAEQFADSIQADRELCKRAALIARDPPNWRNVPGLTDEEKEALENERTEEDGGFLNRWKRFRSSRRAGDPSSRSLLLLFRKGGFWYQTKSLRVTIVTLCFSAIVQGHVQSVSNGANQTMPEYFNLKYDDSDTNNYKWKDGRESLFKYSLINAITYLMAGICGCWFSDPLQSGVLGRRGAIFVSGCLCFISAIGAALSSKWWVLLIWRGILGVGLGSKASITPIFGAEVAPSHLRGKLVMNWQLYDALGIFFGFSANLFFYWTGDVAWKFQIATAAIPAGVLIALVWTIPESPRWLLKKGRGKDAFASLCQLRPTKLQAATELLYANAQLQMELQNFREAQDDAEASPDDHDLEKNGRIEARTTDPTTIIDLSSFSRYRDAVKATSYFRRVKYLFSNWRTSRATLAATVVMIGQQFCGVNVLAFYSTTFFQNINGQTTRNIDALWLSWGIGLANFVFTFPAYWGIDRLGRRYLLLITYPFMIICLLGATLSFLGGTDTERSIRVGIFTFFFILFYSLGQGPVAFAYSSEVFPLFNREAGMSWAVFINLFFAGLLTLFVPLAQVTGTELGGATRGSGEPEQAAWLNNQARLLGTFTGLCTLSLILIFMLVPETKFAASSLKNKKMTVNYISLEELNHIFNVRTWLLIKYHTTHVLPYPYHYIRYKLKMMERGKKGEEGEEEEKEEKAEKVEKPKLEVMYYWAEVEQNEDTTTSTSDQDTSSTRPRLMSRVGSQGRHGSTASSQTQRRQRAQNDSISRIRSLPEA